MSFKLFEHLDKALVSMETRTDFTSKSARVWPSEASALLIDSEGPATVVGGCHRKTFYRLIGEKTTSQMDSVGARRVRTGKAVEEDTTLQAMEAGIHVASGVRTFIPQLNMAFELDLVVIDPQSLKPVICENKTIHGYFTTSKIFGNKYKSGMPKLEHLLQTLIYINEINTVDKLKQVITDCVTDKESGNKRNRIRVTDENLGLLTKGDTPVCGKIAYETRDTCETCEFDVDIYTDFDGSRYPMVNGDVIKTFTVDSIYERFEVIQNYFNKAQQEAIARLWAQGVNRPDPLPYEPKDEAVIASQKELEKVYWDRVGEEMRRLGPDYLPPADFEYKYSDSKIKDLASKGLIGQTKFKEWQTWKNGKRRKAGVPVIGDWQCRYCPYKLPCIQLQNPEMSSIIADMMESDDDGLPI